MSERSNLPTPTNINGGNDFEEDPKVYTWWERVAQAALMMVFVVIVAAAGVGALGLLFRAWDWAWSG